MGHGGRKDDERAAASRREPSGECPPGHDPHDIDGRMATRLAEMRALLARMRPTSDAEALQALRSAFPEVSLSDRVAVLSRRG